VKKRFTVISVMLLSAVSVALPVVVRESESVAQPLTAAAPEPVPMLCAQREMGCDGPFFQVPPGGPGDMGGHERQRKQKYLEQFRLLKLLEELDLNEGQEVPFMTAFRAMRRQLRASGLKRKESLERLQRALSDENIADSEIYDLVAAVMRTDDSIRQIRQTFLKTAKGTLTPIQYGKLIIFQEKFDAELLQAAGFFRRGRQPDGNRRNR